jgi:hypothetical protein
VFPLGKTTGLLQAAREAEVDVYALVIAARRTPEAPALVMKSVANAVLALVDVATDLGGMFMRHHARQLDSEQLTSVKAAKQAFERARQPIEKALRDHVRNSVSAHRDQQTVESIARTQAALSSPDFPALFKAVRAFIDAMEAVPVWAWGRSGQTGVIGVRCSNYHPWQDVEPAEDRFPVRVHAAFTVVVDGPDGECERSFASDTDAHAWGDGRDASLSAPPASAMLPA